MTDPAEAPPCVGSHLSGALVLVGAVLQANIAFHPVKSELVHFLKAPSSLCFFHRLSRI